MSKRLASPALATALLFLFVAVQSHKAASEPLALQPAAVTDAASVMETRGTTASLPSTFPPPPSEPKKPSDRTWVFSGDPDADVDTVLRLSQRTRSE